MLWSSVHHPRRSAQAEAAAEARLRGPHAFPLERLLAVHCALLRSLLDAPQPAEAEQSAELLMQLATLVSLRLLSRVRALPWPTRPVLGPDSLPDAARGCPTSRGASWRCASAAAAAAPVLRCGALHVQRAPVHTDACLTRMTCENAAFPCSPGLCAWSHGCVSKYSLTP